MRRTALLAAAVAAMTTFLGSHAGAYEFVPNQPMVVHEGNAYLMVTLEQDKNLGKTCKKYKDDGHLPDLPEGVTCVSSALFADTKQVISDEDAKRLQSHTEILLRTKPPEQSLSTHDITDVVQMLKGQIEQYKRKAVQERVEHQQLVTVHLPQKRSLRSAEVTVDVLKKKLREMETKNFSQTLVEEWAPGALLVVLVIALMMNAKVRMRKFLANSRELRFQSMIEDLSQQIEDLKKEKATLSSPESFRTLQKRIDWLDGKWVGAEIVARVVDDNYLHTNSEGQEISDTLCYLPRWGRWGEAAFCTGRDLDHVIMANLKREQEEQMFSDASGSDDNVVPLRRVGVATE